MLKKWSSLLVSLALSIAMFAVLSTSVNAVVINGDYEVELYDVNYDSGTNLQTWTYNITCLDGHGISHIVFEFKTVCDPPLSAISQIQEGAWGPSISDIEIVNPDPTTGKVGIKFEFDPSLEPGNSMLVWFSLIGEWPVGTIEVWTKAATGSDISGIVDGPECRPNNNIPEVPFGSIMAGASMLVALVAYSIVRKRSSKQKVQ